MELCEVCAKIDLRNLSSTSKRASLPDDFRGAEICKLQKVQNLSISCPLCLIIRQVLSSSTFTLLDQEELQFTRDQDVVYLEPQRADYALCGVDLEFRFGSEDDNSVVSSCLSIETLDKSYHDKIVVLAPAEEFHRSHYNLVCQVAPHADFSVFKSWLSCCLAMHMDYYPYQAPESPDIRLNHPLRVIDVRAKSLVSVSIPDAKYATLSYVWGPQFPKEAGSYHLDPDLLANMLPTKLPQTFQDALAVCTELEIPYLWIDAICINQVDTVAKEAEIKRMDAIFEASHLTIISIEGESPYAGLPGVSIEREARSEFVQKCGELSLTLLPGFIPLKSVWNKRAWTLQEALLSKRLLVFNKTHISSYCCTSAIREDLSHSDHSVDQLRYHWNTHQSTVFTNLFAYPVFEMARYTNLVSLYTPRHMSDPRDALNAFSGLVNFWSRRNDMTFHQGLPHKNLSDALIWFGTDYASRGNPSIPSWTWAAWRGEIFYHCISMDCLAFDLGERNSIYRYAH